MKINVADLLNKKVTNKEVHLVFEMESFSEEGETIRFVAPVNLDCELTSVEDIINLDGFISTELKLSCSRCLDIFNYKVGVEIHERFSVNLDDKDDDIILIDSDVIDVTEVIKNNIIMALPIKKLCKDVCKGLCQHCGNNLNLSPCNCVKEDIDPRFLELKDLFSAD